MTARRTGFTVIELLVVIGIIMVLMGIAVWGLVAINNNASDRETRTILQNCQSMLEELRRETQLAGLPTTAVPAPGNVSPGTNDRTASAAVVQTHDRVWVKLRQVQSNRTAWGQLPSSRQEKWGTSDTPMLLDSWSNPIIYVPANGLSNVLIGGQARTITTPDRRPFFASAGKDGSFSNGDDNLYSFEK